MLRPNHVLRSQIVEFRERHGLPALPGWEPDPQETVIAAPAADPPPPPLDAAGPLGAPVMMHPAQMVQVLTQLLADSPALAAQLEGMGVPGAASDPQTAVAAICQNPGLMQHVMAFVSQTPEGQRLLGSFLGRPAGPGGMGPPNPVEPPMFQAARQGEVAVVERLIGQTRGAELTAQLSPAGDTLLHVACWEGKVRLVRMLLSRGHDVHALSRNKSTPLHYAAWNGHGDTVQTMLEAGAETERHMQGGDTALHQAAWDGHTRAAQLLLDNGASMSATKEDGDTPLHLACLRKQLGVARLLIERKSELGSRNNRRGTALHAASASGCAEAVTLLLDAGADIDSEMANAERALHLASFAGHEAVAAVLIERGASVDPKVRC